LTAITVRLDPKSKNEAQAVFDELGITTTQAISLFLKQVSLRKGLPFPVEIPNEETRKAMNDASSRHELTTFDDADSAIKSLAL
jgi:addiction module antitoxin, RelB/DinJ family